MSEEMKDQNPDAAIGASTTHMKIIALVTTIAALTLAAVSVAPAVQSQTGEPKSCEKGIEPPTGDCREPGCLLNLSVD